MYLPGLQQTRHLPVRHSHVHVLPPLIWVSADLHRRGASFALAARSWGNTFLASCRDQWDIYCPDFLEKGLTTAGAAKCRRQHGGWAQHDEGWGCAEQGSLGVGAHKHELKPIVGGPRGKGAASREGADFEVTGCQKSDPTFSSERQGTEAIGAVTWLLAQGTPEQAEVTL